MVPCLFPASYKPQSVSICAALCRSPQYLAGSIYNLEEGGFEARIISEDILEKEGRREGRLSLAGMYRKERTD